MFRLHRLRRNNYFTIIFEILLGVLIMVLNPLNIESDLDEISRASFMKLYSPFYEEKGRQDIVVIMIRDDDVEKMWPADTGKTWPMDYEEYRRLFKVIIDQKPKAMFVDIAFDTIRDRMPTPEELVFAKGGKEAINALLKTYHDSEGSDWDTYDFLEGINTVFADKNKSLKKSYNNLQFDHFVAYLTEEVKKGQTKIILADSYLPSTIFNSKGQYRPALVKELKDTGVDRAAFDWLKEDYQYPMKFHAKKAYEAPYWRKLLSGEENPEWDYPKFVEELPTPAAALYQEYIRPENPVNPEPVKGDCNHIKCGPDMSVVWGLTSAPDTNDATKVYCFKENDVNNSFCRKFSTSLKILKIGVLGAADTEESSWQRLQPCYYQNSYSASEIVNLLNTDPQKLADILKDKLVILGANIVGIDDTVSSYTHGKVPAAYLHAMALDNLISYQKDYFIDPDPVFSLFDKFEMNILDITEILFLMIGGWFAYGYTQSDEYKEMAFREKFNISLIVLAAASVSLVALIIILSYFRNYVPVNWVALVTLITSFSLPDIESWSEALDQSLKKKSSSG